MSTVIYTFESTNSSNRITLEELRNFQNISIFNSSGSVLIFPSNQELLTLFPNNPLPGETKEWNFITEAESEEPLAPLELKWDERSIFICSSPHGNYKISLQVYKCSESELSFNITYLSYCGSIQVPQAGVQTVNSTTTTILWQYLIAGSAYPPELMIVGNSIQNQTLYLDSGINLWNKLFANISMPACGSIYFGDIIIMNNTTQTVVVESTNSSSGGVITLIGGTLSVPSYGVLQLKIKFTSKTSSSVTAQAYGEVIPFTV